MNESAKKCKVRCGFFETPAMLPGREKNRQQEKMRRRKSLPESMMTLVSTIISDPMLTAST